MTDPKTLQALQIFAMLDQRVEQRSKPEVFKWNSLIMYRPPKYSACYRDKWVYSLEAREDACYWGLSPEDPIFYLRIFSIERHPKRPLSKGLTL
jgi:hypothetical protein